MKINLPRRIHNVSDSSKPVSPAGKLPTATPLYPRKRAILIGASSGIGAALAARLAHEGYMLALLARRSDQLKTICDEINKNYQETRAMFYQHDVLDTDAIPDLLREIVADLGGLDLFIYNAGVNFPPGPDQLNFENDRAMVEINLVGAMAWLTPVADLFKNMHGGQIVGISSVAGDRGRVGNPGYNTSKAALTTYLEALRNRLTRYGVNVLTVKPGFVETEMLKAAQGATPFTISTERAVNDIWNAIRKRKQLIYTASIWRWIMLVIQLTPSVIFRRLSI